MRSRSFNRVCGEIFFALNDDRDILKMPICRRFNGNNDRNPLVSKDTSEGTEYVPSYRVVPAGFDFSGDNKAIHISDLSTLRFRKDDGEKLRQEINRQGAVADGPATGSSTTNESGSIGSSPPSPDIAAPTCSINTVYFPLISLLLPKWLESINEQSSGDTTPNKIMLLITGAGTPADSQANFVDNSTEYQGKLVMEFLKVVHPDIKVIHIHTSDLNIFRYDDNIEFVKVYLNPHIENFRSKAAKLYGAEWKNKFNLTLSFADGSSARTSAINAAIRLYK